MYDSKGKEVGVGFTPWSVERIRAKKKTVTRRLTNLGIINEDPDSWRLLGVQKRSGKLLFENEDGVTRVSIKPIAKPGDLIWVRETWKVGSFMEGEPVIFQFKDGTFFPENDCEADNYEEWYERIAVQSTDELIKMDWPYKDGDEIFVWEAGKSPLKWRPSIHLPRWGSRIDLICTGARAERLLTITEAEAKAEGCEASELIEMKDGSPCYTTPFRLVWENIYGIDNPKAWESNPWVFAISFELVEDRS